MSKYRQRSTGDIKTQGEVKGMHKNVSFSKVVDTYADLGWDAIEPTPMPAESSPLKMIVEDAPSESGGKWTQVWVEVDRYSTPAEEAAATLEHAEKLKEQVSSMAKAKRDGGITVSNLDIATDMDARSLLTGAKQGGKPTRKMVGKNFRAEVSKVEFDAIVDAVDDHIQAVFDTEYDLHEAIDAVKTDIVALQAIDLDTGWPV